MSVPSPVFVIGFMAAGKSTVGAAVAARLGRRFVELDAEIDAGPEGVAALVARDEPAFRQLEAAALARVLARLEDAPVVATGGGCATWGDNLSRMRAAGTVIALTVDVADVRARAVGGPMRPLLGGDDAAVIELVARRLPSYRRAHAVVPTSGRPVASVVDDVLAVARQPHSPSTTWLVTGGTPTPISTEGGGFDQPLARLRDVVRGRTGVALVVDGGLAAARPTEVAAVMQATGAITQVVVPAGEASKSLDSYARVADAILAAGLDRDGIIVALGGGVVGDLAGFVAATLFRGVAVVQVPTTLLAMVDSAIGGKTAIDRPAGKNVLGAFHQPRAVVSWTGWLASLPARERAAAFGELWKYALLDGGRLWSQVQACCAWATGQHKRVPDELAGMIEACVRHKAWIVAHDPDERRGERMLLNLGHTVGHVIEAETGMLHGEAVGLGLVAAARVSEKLGLCGPGLDAEITGALAASGLPSDPWPHVTSAALARLGVDKKRRGPQMRFVAVREVGRCEVVDVAVDELLTILRSEAAV